MSANGFEITVGNAVFQTNGDLALTQPVDHCYKQVWNKCNNPDIITQE